MIKPGDRVRFYTDGPITDEQREFGHRWIAALRSGEYTQGHGVLRTPQDSFCCLGVAADVLDPERWERVASDECDCDGDDVGWYWMDPETVINNDGTESQQPASAGFTTTLRRRTGIATGLADFNRVSSSPQPYSMNTNHQLDNHLAALNDTSFTFDQIADLLEQNLYGPASE